MNRVFLRRRFFLMAGASVAFAGSALAAVPGVSSAASGGSSGGPIKIATIGTFSEPSIGFSEPEVAAGVQSRVKYINAHGGINGRKVSLTVCNMNGTPNQAATCARNAVASKVVAVVGGSSANDPNWVPIIQQAGIPIIGVVPTATIDATASVSFPVVSGTFGQWAGMASLLAKQGSKHPYLFYPGIPAGTALVPYFTLGLSRHGLKAVGSLPVAPTTTDMGPPAATVKSANPDGLAGYLLGDAANEQFFTTLSQAGISPSNTKMATISSFLTPTLLSTLGSKLNGMGIAMLTEPPTATKVAGIRQYNSDMQAFNASLPRTDESVATWTAAYVFQKVVQSIKGPVTSATVLKAMRHVTNLSTLGVTPPLTTTKPSKAFPGLSRLFNPTVVYGKVVNSKIQATSGPVNPVT